MVHLLQAMIDEGFVEAHQGLTKTRVDVSLFVTNAHVGIFVYEC